MSASKSCADLLHQAARLRAVADDVEYDGLPPESTIICGYMHALAVSDLILTDRQEQTP